MKNKNFTQIFRFFFLVYFLFFLSDAIADISWVKPTGTDMESTTSRMISYRQQDHMWVTHDGAIHVMMNQGDYGNENNSLILYSSFNDGKSWSAMLTLSNTDETSTSDGILDGETLDLVYSTDTGSIISVQLFYDSLQRSWDIGQLKTVFSSQNLPSHNPAIARDDLGRLWCVIIRKSTERELSDMRVFLKEDAFTDWQDTGLSIASTESVSPPQMSARPVATDGGIGIVFTVDNKIKWAYRENSRPLNQQFDGTVIFTHQLPFDNDPYASHFSVAVDEFDNIHVSTIDEGALLYMRYDGGTGEWEDPRNLTQSNLKVAYMQTTIANGRVLIFFNFFSLLGVLQSSNQGDSFVFTHILTHPSTSLTGADYSNPRVETPSSTDEDYVPLLQQYVNSSSVQRLMYFKLVP